MSKAEQMTPIIIKSFPGVKMVDQYFVLSKRIDLYLPDQKLNIEVNEKGHIDRKKEKEEERKNKIKKELDYKFIRINPDSEKKKLTKEIKNKRRIKKNN